MCSYRYSFMAALMGIARRQNDIHIYIYMAIFFPPFCPTAKL